MDSQEVTAVGKKPTIPGQKNAVTSGTYRMTGPPKSEKTSDKTPNSVIGHRLTDSGKASRAIAGSAQTLRLHDRSGNSPVRVLSASEPRLQRQRAELVRLIMKLSDGQLDEAKKLLKGLTGPHANKPSGEKAGRNESPFLRALRQAPVDDEPETSEEAKAVQLAKDEMARGEVVSHIEAWRQLNDEAD